jgi:hypothetical protein
MQNFIKLHLCVGGFDVQSQWRVEFALWMLIIHAKEILEADVTQHDANSIQRYT